MLAFHFLFKKQISNSVKLFLTFILKFKKIKINFFYTKIIKMTKKYTKSIKI